MMVGHEQRQQLIDEIARIVPEELLVQIVETGSVMANVHQLRLTVEDKLNGRYHKLTSEIVAAYETAGELNQLLAALYKKVDWNAGLQRILAPLVLPKEISEDVREATHRRRDHFIRSGTLSKFIREFEPRVGCIIGEWQNPAGATESFGGTCFLVAPDLLMTSAHVFEAVIAKHGELWMPEHCAVYFDYLDDPEVASWNDPRKDVRRVKLAKDWLVAISPSEPSDGLVDAAAVGRAQILQQKLDFALVRLEQKVGLEPVSRFGGRRREWIELPKSYPLLGTDSYVNIVQHPYGRPLSYGFGRYDQPCASTSRMWYDTETDKGSSGAPCLTRDLELVGVHNAEYRVPGQKLLNQAVRIDAIAAQVAAIINAALAPFKSLAPIGIWNVSTDPSSPRVVLGRDTFLAWIIRATESLPARRADRIFAALAARPKSGKTFSIEILQTHLRGHREHRFVVLGTERELVPATVEDFLRILLDQLGIAASELTGMPLRPTADLPSDAPDGDKVRRWASTTVPAWFAGLLESHAPSRRDLRVAASRQIAQLQAAGEAVPPELTKLAIQPEPAFESEGWGVTWIVFDRLDQVPLSPEVLDLVAGLSVGNSDDATLPLELKRIRWVFLGRRPDFYQAGDVTVELLDAGLVGTAEMETTIKAAMASRSRFLSDADLDTVRFTLGSLLAKLTGLPMESRLPFLQELTRVYIEPIIKG